MQKSASGKCPHSPSGCSWFLPQPRGFGDAIVPEWAGGNLVTLSGTGNNSHSFIHYRDL